MDFINTLVPIFLLLAIGAKIYAGHLIEEQKKELHRLEQTKRNLLDQLQLAQEHNAYVAEMKGFFKRRITEQQERREALHEEVQKATAQAARAAEEEAEDKRHQRLRGLIQRSDSSDASSTEG